MSNILKVLITVFIIGLVVMAIIFFSIFGIVPAEKLSEALKGGASTSTERGETIVVSTTTIIERIIEREVLVEREDKEEEEPKKEEPAISQPPIDREPSKFEDKYEYAFRISGGEFSPSIITANKRDDVMIGLLSEDKVYTISIPDYGLSQTVGPGEEKLIAFQALSAGEFEILCEGCKEGFEAKLIVE